MNDGREKENQENESESDNKGYRCNGYSNENNKTSGGDDNVNKQRQERSDIRCKCVRILQKEGVVERNWTSLGISLASME